MPQCTFPMFDRPAMSRVMNSYRRARMAGRLVLLLSLAAFAGCGNRKMPEVSDASLGRPALETALEAWKSGAAPEALLAGQPSIRVFDEDWKAGRKLLGYQMSGEGELIGLRLRCPVVLSMESLPGQIEQTSVNYLIATSPTIVIRRDDREE